MFLLSFSFTQKDGKITTQTPTDPADILSDTRMRIAVTCPTTSEESVKAAASADFHGAHGQNVHKGISIVGIKTLGDDRIYIQRNSILVIHHHTVHGQRFYWQNPTHAGPRNLK